MFGRKRQVIMLVDDNPTTLSMGKNMLKDFYEVYALPSAERFFMFLETVRPDLVLLDVEMPHISGFDILRLLKADARFTDIPVIFVTAKTKEADELEGLYLGAVDYVTKPFSSAILLNRIKNQLLIKSQTVELKNLTDNLIAMVKEKTEQISGLQNSIINSIAEIVEFRDSFTGGHVHRTQKYVKLLVDYLIENGIYYDEILRWENTDYIVSSTQLHDLGKIFISDMILNKPGRLTSEEFEVMKTHVSKGVDAIRNMGNKGSERAFLSCAETVAGTHHERWDGSGYPLGLKERDIPLLGRLMAIADVYDALVSERPYKAALTAKESARIISEGSGTHFDPALVDVFRNLEGAFAAVA